MTALQSDALYVGRIAHRRFVPKPHAFRYGLFQLYLDTRRIEATLSRLPFCSIGRFNWLQYRRADYFGDPSLSLDEAVRRHAEAETGQAQRGPIFMLTHLRVLGFVMNPVSFYYGFDEDGRTLRWLLAEITNTPWGERFSYFLPIEPGHDARQPATWRFPKRFHVSPFLPMALKYDWRFGTPSEALGVYMRVQRAGERQFDATLTLRRRELSPSSLLRQLLAFPWITAKVAVGIYWNALLLWFKRVPFHDHP